LPRPIAHRTPKIARRNIACPLLASVEESDKPHKSFIDVLPTDAPENVNERMVVMARCEISVRPRGRLTKETAERLQREAQRRTTWRGHLADRRESYAT
jgi:hypothetical protein